MIADAYARVYTTMLCWIGVGYFVAITAVIVGLIICGGKELERELNRSDRHY